MAVQEIKLEKLKIHPNNIRKEYDGIKELARSIKENGIMQNLTVVPDPEEEGMYLVVIGNRRLTAAREAGIETAPCVVVDMSDKDQVLTMLTENMNRKDLKVYEEAAAIQMCFDDFGFNINEIKDKTGLSMTTIYHRKNIAKLDAELVKEKANDKGFQMSLNDLYELEKIEDIEKRNEVLQKANDSANLRWLADRAAKEEKDKKKDEKFIQQCEERGYLLAPKDALYSYDSDFEKVLFYNKEKTELEDIKPIEETAAADLVGADEQLYYIVNPWDLYILKKVQKEEKEEEEVPKWKREQEERAKRKDEYCEVHKQMETEIEDFIKMIITGEVESSADTEELTDRLWGTIADAGVYVENDSMAEIIEKLCFLGEDDCEVMAESMLQELSTAEQMILALFCSTSSTRMMDYHGFYSEESGDVYLQFVEILKTFGFDFTDEESLALIRGTHEVYRKEQEAGGFQDE